MSRAIQSKQYDLLLYAAVPQSSMLEQGFYAAEVEGLRAHPSVRSVAVTNRLADVLSTRYDGLICYFYSYTAFAALVGRLRGKPVVATGGGEQLCRQFAAGRMIFAGRMVLFHLCTLFVDRILATSTTDFTRMRAVAVVGRDRIKLSYHGALAADMAAPEHFGHSRPPSSFVTICGMDTPANVRRKGLLEAIDLVTRFYEVDPSAQLTVIGRTTCQDMVAEHARSRGVGGRIVYAGYVTEEEKLAHLRGNRFYVQLSEYEGFGIGALEALAQGCQVIHSNLGGLRDTIADYGVVITRDAISNYPLETIPPHAKPDWIGFSGHLAHFSVSGRTDTIMRALRLSI